MMPVLLGHLLFMVRFLLQAVVLPAKLHRTHTALVTTYGIVQMQMLGQMVIPPMQVER